VACNCGSQLALLDLDSFYSKVAQPHRMVLARLGEGDNMFGDD
jgi:hypothetical protein